MTGTGRPTAAAAPTHEALAAAAAALAGGGVVGVPTDTVYGLAALAASPEGCAAVFRLKGRPAAVALPVLVGDLDTALGLAAERVRPRLAAVGAALWPGPLTVVVPAARPLGHLGGDGSTVGLRLPDDPVVTALCRAAGPLAVTSANRHKAPPCTQADEVVAAFPDGVAVVLDGGRRDGTPSSVVALGEGPAEEDLRLLRAGPVPLEAVRAALAPPREAEGRR